MSEEEQNARKNLIEAFGVLSEGHHTLNFGSSFAFVYVDSNGLWHRLTPRIPNE